MTDTEDRVWTTMGQIARVLRQVVGGYDIETGQESLPMSIFSISSRLKELKELLDQYDDQMVELYREDNPQDDDDTMARPYPTWICYDCGMKYGRSKGLGVATWHEGQCDVCYRLASVTEPRDFGHLRDGWQFNDVVKYGVVDDYGDNWRDGAILFSSEDLQEVYDWKENENYHSASLVMMINGHRVKLKESDE